MKVTDAEVRFIRSVIHGRRMRRGSAKRLANAFGITPWYLNRLARGKRRPLEGRST